MSDTPRLLDDSVAIAQQIDQLCDAFEADWSAGQAPSIENFLVRVAEVDQEQLLRELLAIDLFYRTKNGEQPQPAEYIARFPSLDPVWMDQVTCSMSSGDTQVVARHRADHSERPADESGLTDRFLRHLSRQSQFGTHWSAVDSTGAAELKGTANVEELIALLEPATEPNELGRLGSFRVLKVLGRGGMGVVFLAEDTQLRRHVALKLLHPGYSREGDAVERFMREARAAAAVRHDNIVTIFQVGHVNGVPFLAQELLEGETLDDRLRRQEKLPIRHALCIGREIAAGLAAAHARGLLHRDIKPSNIWLETSHHSSTAAFRTKLLDFGLARVASDDTQLTTSGMIVGTPAFMSPEQAQGKSVDIRSDLFSLGCVLYRMVTGEMPFQGTDTLSMLRSLAIDVPLPARELNPEITSELSDFIAKLLHKDPLQRAGSAEFVASRLAAIASTLDGPPAGHSSSPISRSIAGHITRTPRRLAVALGLGVILSLLAAAIIITITRPDGSKTEIRVDGDAKVEVAIVNSKPRVNSVEGPLPQADEWAGNKSSVPPAVAETSPKPSQPQPLFDNDFSSDQILQARVRAKMLEPSMLDIFSIEDGRLIIQASPGGQGRGHFKNFPIGPWTESANIEIVGRSKTGRWGFCLFSKRSKDSLTNGIMVELDPQGRIQAWQLGLKPNEAPDFHEIPTVTKNISWRSGGSFNVLRAIAQNHQVKVSINGVDACEPIHFPDRMPQMLVALAGVNFEPGLFCEFDSARIWRAGDGPPVSSDVKAFGKHTGADLQGNTKGVAVLGMTLVDPSDDLVKSYELPEKYPGPIILNIENASSLFPSGMAAFEGCAFWVVEHPANGFLYSKHDKPRFQPTTIQKWAESVVACTASPDEYEQLLNDTRQAARQRAENLNNKPEEKERLLRVENATGFGEENAGKYICRVVYHYPKTSGRSGTMTTYMRMTKEQLEEVNALIQE